MSQQQQLTYNPARLPRPKTCLHPLCIHNGRPQPASNFAEEFSLWCERCHEIPGNPYAWTQAEIEEYRIIYDDFLTTML